MTNLIYDNISLILLLPLWIFTIIMGGRFFSVYVNKGIICFLSLLCSFLGAGTCAVGLFKLQNPIDWIYPFININDFHMYFGLRIDKLSLTLAVILFVVSFCVQLFSISYMKNEEKNYKFYALLNLFNFAMAFLLFSPNLFQLYVFWELVGIVSYLLIGFDYKNPVKSDASKRVFIINRIGDTALITGIIVVSVLMYNYAGNTTFAALSFEDMNTISTLLLAYTSTPVLVAVCGLFIIAAAVKSAQFPFYTWLQAAMEAKLPVSALLHSATMVVAGVYLLIRLLSFFTLHHYLMYLIFAIGIITALTCGILGCIETNPKKVLAYSTSANLGLMFTAVGMGNIKAAVILLAAHAFIKSSLFLLLPKENEKEPLLNIVLFGLGSLSLAGMMFAGIGAKEFLYTSYCYSEKLSLLFLIISFITALYITRLFLLIYKNIKITNTINLTEFISFLILFLCNLTLYILLRKSYAISEPYAAAIAGLCLALLLYKHNALNKFSDTPKLLEKISYNLIPLLYAKISEMFNKFEIKIFANYKPIYLLSAFAVKVTDWVETNIMNRTVTMFANTIKSISKQDIVLQKGNVQTYNGYAFIIVTLVIAFVIIGYTLLIS